MMKGRPLPLPLFPLPPRCYYRGMIMRAGAFPLPFSSLFPVGDEKETCSLSSSSLFFPSLPRLQPFPQTGMGNAFPSFRSELAAGTLPPLFSLPPLLAHSNGQGILSFSPFFPQYPRTRSPLHSFEWEVDISFSLFSFSVSISGLWTADDPSPSLVGKGRVFPFLSLFFSTFLRVHPGLRLFFFPPF